MGFSKFEKHQFSEIVFNIFQKVLEGTVAIETVEDLRIPSKIA